jgi:hypothetical protein
MKRMVDSRTKELEEVLVPIHPVAPESLDGLAWQTPQQGVNLERLSTRRKRPGRQ